MKKFKSKFFILFLSFSLLFCSVVPVYASWTQGQQASYVYENLVGLFLKISGVVLNQNDVDDVYTQFLESVNIEAVSNNMSYDEYIMQKLHFDLVDDKVENVTCDPELANIFVTVANNYIAEHPTTYSYQWIYGADSLNPLYFNGNSDLYYGVIDAINSIDFPYVFIHASNWGRANGFSAGGWHSFGLGQGFAFVYPSSSYGNSLNSPSLVSSGHKDNYVYLTDLRLALGWSAVSWNRSTWNCCFIDSGGNKYILENIDFSVNPNTSSCFNSNYNLNIPDYNSNSVTILNTSGTKEVHFVYDSVDAIALHDTGQPSPYYVTDSYNSNIVYDYSVSFTNQEIVNNNGLYEQITNNLSSGLGAGELNIIINNIIEDNNSKPLPDNGGGGSGDDSDDSLFDKLFGSIGGLFKKIIEGIASLLSSIIEGITALIDTVISAVSGFIEIFTQGAIIDLLTSFLAWLPDPLPKLIIGLFSLSLTFAVIRLVKGVFS